jgi:excisionase family DNA binding protein
VTGASSVSEHPRCITADELAELLSISRSHVFHLASGGRIPSIRIGRSVRFELDRVLAALRNNESAA